MITYMMRLELLLRKVAYDRLDSLLSEDLTPAQIRALKVCFFDNFFRLNVRGRPSLDQKF